MAIKSIGIRTAWNGLVLTVTEDFDYGYDWRGDPHSMSKERTRDAIPSDMIEIIKNNVGWKS
jgi:hypothetical protein